MSSADVDPAVSCRIDADGIATLVWNVADRPMNVLNEASIQAFRRVLDELIADSAVRGVIVTSSRPEFVVGADLDLLRNAASPAEAMAMAASISEPLRRLERSGKPFVAAINGTALGGGYEIALACHRRIAADDPDIRIGLPEVTLGLLPGAGGTQRLPRMIGLAKATPYLLEGRKVAVGKALEDGLVDEVVPAGELLERARAWLLEAGSGDGAARTATKPWDAKGFRFPGGAPQAPGPMQLFFGVPGMLLGRTQGLYPAPEAILSCLYDGCQVDLDSGLRIEQRQFARLATSAPTRNMIRSLFYSMGEANRLADRPRDVPRRHYRKVAVLGAGMMGSGLAHACAQAGLGVALLDASQDAADRGKAYSRKLLDTQVAKGRLGASQRDEILARIVPTIDYDALADIDLVIEAVFEDRAVKAGVIGRAEAAMPADAIFAINTSTLPITSLAAVSVRPAQFVGLHFFSPVEKMPLVEIIRGKATAEATIAHALDFVKAIRKTPIVVNDCPAFYANRAFAMFPYEAMILLKEGVKPALIENVARQAGMPMPPLALVDEVSVELLYKAMKQRRLDEGAAYEGGPQDEVMTAMVETLGRPGRKAGKGFYDYPADGRKVLWPGLAEHWPLADAQPDPEAVRVRLMYAQSVEAARCVAEGIVGVRDADVGSILGWGFPAALGGVIGQIDTVGVASFVAQCDRLADAHGPRFAVSPALREMAASGRSYFA